MSKGVEDIGENIANSLSSTINAVVNNAKTEVSKQFNLDNIGTINSKTGKEEEEYVNNTITSSQELIDKFGIRQEIVIVGDNDDALLKSQRILNDNCLPKEEITVEVLGDLSFRVGWGVHVIIDWLPTDYKDCFMYIKEFKHVWKAKGQFVTQLTLTPSRVMDTKEWTDVEESSSNSDNSSSGSSAMVEKAVTWAIGIANDNSHGYSQSSRWGNPDYDCSSFVISAFEQAGIPLKTNGATYTGDMKQVCLNTGFEEVSWGGSVGTLKRGDILLNEAKHTAIYIGDGKLVHASGTKGHPESGDQNGDEVCVRDFYNYPWDCVLRYKIVAQDFSGTIESCGVSSNYIELLKSLEGYVDHWDKSSKYGAIGYGTDASSTVGKRLKAQGVTSCTEAEATQWLIEEVKEWADAVTARISSKGYSMNQYCFDVATDICYQWGNQQWGIIDMLGNGDIENAKSRILNLGYPRRDKARVAMLEGDYTPPN